MSHRPTPLDDTVKQREQKMSIKLSVHAANLRVRYRLRIQFAGVALQQLAIQVFVVRNHSSHFKMFLDTPSAGATHC
jgi:hypothetical protein